MAAYARRGMLRGLDGERRRPWIRCADSCRKRVQSLACLSGSGESSGVAGFSDTGRTASQKA